MSEDEFVIRPGTVLALETGAAEFLVRRGGRISRAERSVYAAARGAAGQSRSKAPRIAVVEIQGFMGPGIPSWLGTDTFEAAAAVRAARFDPGVDGLALLVDSPGGYVTGVEELYTEILETRAAIPTAAIVAGLACSAAYYAASAASRIYTTPSGCIGSIGVYSTHIDLSRALDKEGITVSLIAAAISPYKTEGNVFEPLGDGARAEQQRQVNIYGDRFVSHVAAGREVSRQVVLAAYGKGRVFDAREAIQRGMADELALPEQALLRMMEGTSRPRASIAPDFMLEDGHTLAFVMAQEAARAKLAAQEQEQRVRQGALARLRTL